jgi:hypothetical protein
LEPNQLDEFFLRIFSLSEFESEMLPPQEKQYSSLKQENFWNLNSNVGGSLNLYSFYFNDQFNIETDKDTLCTVILSQDVDNEDDLTNIFCYLLNGNDDKTKNFKGEKFEANSKAR